MIRRVVRADVAADGAAVANLDVGDLIADLAENRTRARLCGVDDVGVGRHRPELERPVGAELDATQLTDVCQVDEDVRRGRTRLHHVDQSLATGECTSTVICSKKAQGFLNARGTSVLDLPQKHALFSAETPAQVKKQLGSSPAAIATQTERTRSAPKPEEGIGEGPPRRRWHWLPAGKQARSAFSGG